MEMDFMAHQAPFLNKAIPVILIAALMMLTCNSRHNYNAAVPNIYIQSNDLLLNQQSGILYYNKHPYSGYTYQLYENGDTIKVTPYIIGKEEGWVNAYYAKGRLAEERLYVHGRKEGMHKGWWMNGNLKFEYHFINDEHEGELKEWYSNEKPARIFNYSKGYEDGAQKMWWENGDIRANYFVKEHQRYGLIGQKLCRNILKDSK
jgi:antitoxin component YwqK of YwqJK toxin-antitoxin module